MQESLPDATFTKVGAFGGSIVSPINAALGNPAVAPECGAAVRIAPDASTDPRVAGSPALPVGQNLFQCCIHPWMQHGHHSQEQLTEGAPESAHGYAE